MYRSLVSRLVAWYVVVAIVLVVAIAAGVSLFALQLYAHNTIEAIHATSQEVPRLAQYYRSEGKPFRVAASLMTHDLERPGLRVLIFDPRDPASLGRVRLTPGVRILLRRVLGTKNSEAGTAGSVPALPASPERRDFTAWQQVAFFVNGALNVRPETVAFRDGVAIVSPDSRRLGELFGTFSLALLAALVATAILAVALGRYITSQALRPLIEVTGALHRFGVGDLTPQPIDATRRSEFRELAEAYNAAVAQVNAAFDERRKAEQQIRQFVAEAGHELRTPLTVIMGYLEVLERGAAEDALLRPRIFATMTSEGERMRGMIDKLIFLARLDVTEHPPKTGVVDLNALAQRVVDTFAPIAGTTTISVRLAPEPVLTEAAEAELHEALATLVENAIKYAPGSTVTVRVGRDGDAAVVSVSDNGPGMTTEEREHAFDRFYRGESRGEIEGSGLGLAICKRAVERANGTVTLASALGQGTTLTIWLPAIPAPRAVPA